MEEENSEFTISFALCSFVSRKREGKLRAMRPVNHFYKGIESTLTMKSGLVELKSMNQKSYSQ